MGAAIYQLWGHLSLGLSFHVCKMGIISHESQCCEMYLYPAAHGGINISGHHVLPALRPLWRLTHCWGTFPTSFSFINPSFHSLIQCLSGSNQPHAGCCSHCWDCRSEQNRQKPQPSWSVCPVRETHSTCDSVR